MGTSMRWWKPGWNRPLGCNLCTVLDSLDRIGHLQHYTASSPLSLTFADFLCTVHVCRRTTAKKKTNPRISIWRPQQMAPSWFNILMSLFNFSPAERALKTKYVWKLPAGSLVISSVNIHMQLDSISFGKARFINVQPQRCELSLPLCHKSNKHLALKSIPHRRSFHHFVSEHTPGVRWETQITHVVTFGRQTASNYIAMLGGLRWQFKVNVSYSSL